MDTSARSQETSPWSEPPFDGVSVRVMTHDTGTMSSEDHIINTNYNMA